MTVWIAAKTLQAFDECVARDGGNTFRRNLGLAMPQMSDAYRDNEDEYRSHLGASVIGGECARSVAYAYRWAYKRPPRGKKGEHPRKAHARMLRLWNRGHMEEGRFIALMMTAGMTIYQQDGNGEQFRVSAHGGHFGGACDGVALGVPDLPPGVPSLTEYKTHGADSFEKLVEYGLRLNKPQHYVQMNIYMGKMGLMYGLYVAVNKNTDELYAEIIQYDGATDAQFLERARGIIYDHKLPARIRGASPGFHVCKYLCDFPAVCFSTVKPDVNCRTCKFWFPMPDGTTQCVNNVLTDSGQRTAILDKQAQIEGCSHYEVDRKLT